MLKKRIPTIFGLILLIIGAFSGVFFLNRTTDFLPRAAPEYAPQKVKITNLSENGFTVSWTTQEPATGFVKYGESASSLSVMAMDERDQLSGSSSEYRTHYITLQNLKPSTIYYFKLGSQKNQLYDNNGQPFQITTPGVLGTPPLADTAYGTVMTAANTPATGAIVYVSLDNSTPVSGLVNQNGNWAVNLSTSRSLDLAEYSLYDPQRARLDILVQPGTGEIAQALTTTGNDQPVPTLTLGQTYDFSNQVAVSEPGSADEQETLNEAETQADSGLGPATAPDSKFSLEDIQATEGEIDNTIKITTLPVDGTEVDSTQPEIKGIAPANANLTISVHSQQAYTDQVQVDAKGQWEWTPPANLEPGEHTLTVSYLDTAGVLHKVSRLFVVSAAAASSSDTDPFYQATPSATPMATPAPTPKATPVPRTTVATSSAGLQAGSGSPTVIILLLGIGIMYAGTYLLKKQY